MRWLQGQNSGPLQASWTSDKAQTDTYPTWEELQGCCEVVIYNALEEEVSRLVLRWPLTSDQSGSLTTEEWEVSSPADMASQILCRAVSLKKSSSVTFVVVRPKVMGAMPEAEDAFKNVCIKEWHNFIQEDALKNSIYLTSSTWKVYVLIGGIIHPQNSNMDLL